jgi:hypothetical protein
MAVGGLLFRCRASRCFRPLPSLVAPSDQLRGNGVVPHRADDDANQHFAESLVPEEGVEPTLALRRTGF